MVISTSIYDDLYVTFDIVPGTLYQVYYAAAAVVPCFFTPDNRYPWHNTCTHIYVLLHILVYEFCCSLA